MEHLASFNVLRGIMRYLFLSLFFSFSLNAMDCIIACLGLKSPQSEEIQKIDVPEKMIKKYLETKKKIIITK